MVFLPESPSSFCFRTQPAGSTKLRDYSSGRMPVGRPLDCRGRAFADRSRADSIYYDPHRTDGAGVGYWSQVTADSTEGICRTRQPTNSFRFRFGSCQSSSRVALTVAASASCRTTEPETEFLSSVLAVPARLTELGAQSVGFAAGAELTTRNIVTVIPGRHRDADAESQ